MNVEDLSTRLYYLENFLATVCIEGGCGYDLKVICQGLIHGEITLTQALYRWKNLGHYVFISPNEEPMIQLKGDEMLADFYANKITSAEVYLDSYPTYKFIMDCDWKLDENGDFTEPPQYNDFSIFEFSANDKKYYSIDGCLADLFDVTDLDNIVFNIRRY